MFFLSFFFFLSRQFILEVKLQTSQCSSLNYLKRLTFAIAVKGG